MRWLLECLDSGLQQAERFFSRLRTHPTADFAAASDSTGVTFYLASLRS